MMKAIPYLICPMLLLVLCCQCNNPCDKFNSERYTTVTTNVSLPEETILKSEGNADVIVFLGDNDQDSTSREAYINCFLILGFDVLCTNSHFDGDSTLAAFTRSGIEFLLKKGYQRNKVVVYGKENSSYGSCMALQDLDVRGLILESVPKAKFDSLLRDIGGVKGKILIIQGDREVDWERSIQLYKRITEVQKRILILPNITKYDIYYDPQFAEIADFFLTENRFKHFEGKSFSPW